MAFVYKKTMTIQQIFDLGLQMGIAADPRGKAGITRYLARRKKEFETLAEKRKAYFDKEVLTNPYADSRVLVGDPKTPVKRILAGIDMHIGEVLLADRLREKGQQIDLIVAHHPEGHALAALHEVMDLQIDTLAKLGIPINIAEKLMASRITQVSRKFHPANHEEALDAAKLLAIPYLAMHTIWDNMGHTFVEDYLQAKKAIDTVGDVYDALMEIPEYQASTRQKAGPIIAVGSEKNRAGKIVVGFTGGTEGAKELYEHLARAGVGTLVDMHVDEERRKEIDKYHMNLIITGHMASDSIGANLFFDAVEKKGVEVIPCSGLVRVKR